METGNATARISSHCQETPPSALQQCNSGQRVQPYQLSVEGGEQAIRGDDDGAGREGLSILVEGVQVVTGGGGLSNGAAAQEHEDIPIGLDVGEEAGDPPVAPVVPYSG